jgi:hypothetical protein
MGLCRVCEFRYSQVPPGRARLAPSKDPKPRPQTFSTDSTDTSPSVPAPSPDSHLPQYALPGRHGQCRNPPQHASKQPPQIPQVAGEHAQPQAHRIGAEAMAGQAGLGEDRGSILAEGVFRSLDSIRERAGVGGSVRGGEPGKDTGDKTAGATRDRAGRRQNVETPVAGDSALFEYLFHRQDAHGIRREIDFPALDDLVFLQHLGRFG